MELPPTTDTIVVTAPRLPEAPGQAVYSSIVIDEETLARSLRLDAAIAQAPGAALFRRNDSGAANPTIQGMSLRAIGPSGAGRALVTLDGAPLSDPFGGWTIWGGLPPELISRVNVVRGAGAGPYGAGALTGTVALEERSTPGFVLSAETGELGFWRAAGVGEAQSGGLDFLLAAAAEHSDGWIPVRDGRGAADRPLWRDGMSAAARLQSQQGHVLISARVSGYDEDRSNGLAGGFSGATGGSASLTLVAQPDEAHVGWRVQGWARQSDMRNAFLAVATDRSSTTPASLQYETPAIGWGVNAAMRWTNAELGVDVRAADGETHELFRFIGNDFTRSRVAGGETLSTGAYLEAWHVLGDLLLSGGGRVDWWRAADGVRIERDLANGAAVLDLRPEDSEHVAPTARFGARYELTDALFVRAAAYTGFRPPTLNELHRPFRVGNDVTEANPDLEPEKLYGIDAALGGEHESWSWSVGVFANRLVDPVTNVTVGVGPGTFPPNVVVPAGGVFRVRQNAGEINAVGLEGEARGGFGADLDWRAAFDVTDAEVDGKNVAPQLTGLSPAQAAPWTVTAGVSWRAWEGGELSADVRAEGARYDDDLNSRKLAAYTRADLRVSQHLTDTAQIYLAVDNAFDDAIETEVSAIGTVSYAAPRVVRVGVRLAR